MKLVCNVNKSDNSEEYAQKPKRNFTFKNSASDVASASDGGAMKQFPDEETNVIVVIIHHFATAAKRVIKRGRYGN